MVLIKIEAKFTKKRSKSRDRNFFRFLALFLTICLLKKGGADKPPPISKRVKGSRQRERRGVGNVANGPNLSRTAAIDVLFFINSAVV